MKIEEAKQKWCPMAMSSNGKGDYKCAGVNIFQPSYNRLSILQEDKSYINAVPHSALCIADECACWIWTITEVSGFPQGQALPKDQCEGRCGLLR